MAETTGGRRGRGLCEYRGVRVCITGGTGFIGAATCRALCARDPALEVVVLDDALHSDADVTRLRARSQSLPAPAFEGGLLATMRWFTAACV